MAPGKKVLIWDFELDERLPDVANLKTLQRCEDDVYPTSAHGFVYIHELSYGRKHVHYFDVSLMPSDINHLPITHRVC